MNSAAIPLAAAAAAATLLFPQGPFFTPPATHIPPAQVHLSRVHLPQIHLPLGPLLIPAPAQAAELPLPPLESPALKFKQLPTFPESLDGSNPEEKLRIRKPKSDAAGRCVQKCVGTCIRGGAGAPGEGPFNVRRPLVVFKEEFRSRKYCLSECTDICNLLPEGEDGP